MPIYEYHCKECEKQKEIIVRMNQDYKVPVCEQCNKTMEKAVSNSSFELKGTGWTPRGIGYLK